MTDPYHISPEQMASFVEDSPFAVLLIDPQEDRVLWANFVAQEWFERSLKSMQRTEGLENLTLDYTQLCKAIERVRQSNGAVSAHDSRLRLPQSERELRVNFTAYPTRSGIAVILRPVEPGMRPEASQTAESAVGALGRMLAHELKNPLAGIRGAAQLLSADIQSEEGKELIDLIGTEIDRIKRLAEQMERYGDTPHFTARPVNVHTILRRTRLMAENSTDKDIAFSEHYDPSLPFASGNSDSLMQAALNIVKNAVEAISSSGQGGEIKLQTTYRSGVKRSGAAHGSNAALQNISLPIEIKIIDDGPGVSEAIRKEIFQPFITDKPNGQGLGLSLVSKIVAAHGGLIELRSKPGQTIFSILLPAATGAPVQESENHEL